MIYIFISDLHLGAPDSAFDLGQFHRLSIAKGWLAPNTVLILAGDVSDGAYMDEKAGTRALHDLDMSLLYVNKLFIPGNHDVMCTLRGRTVPVGFTVNTAGGHVHFTHGHMCSPYLFSVLEELLAPNTPTLEDLHEAAKSTAKALMTLAHTQLAQRPVFELILKALEKQASGNSIARATTGIIRNIAKQMESRVLGQMSGLLGKALSWYIADVAPSLARSQSIEGSEGLITGICKYVALLDPQPDHLVMGHTHQLEFGTELIGEGMEKPVKVWNPGCWQRGESGVVVVDTKSRKPKVVRVTP